MFDESPSSFVTSTPITAALPLEALLTQRDQDRAFCATFIPGHVFECESIDAMLERIGGPPLVDAYRDACLKAKTTLAPDLVDRFDACVRAEGWDNQKDRANEQTEILYGEGDYWLNLFAAKVCILSRALISIG